MLSKRRWITGKLDPVSTADHMVFVGQEFRDWQNGHVILLGIKQLIEPFEPFGGKFQDRHEPNLVLGKALREARGAPTESAPSGADRL